MVVSLTQELDAARCGQGPERVYHLGGEALELVQGAAGDGIGYLELAFAPLDQLEHQGVHRKVALLCHPPEDGPVGEIVIIVGVFADIEETVQAETGGLMDLEIQADTFRCHRYVTLLRIRKFSSFLRSRRSISRR